MLLNIRSKNYDRDKLSTSRKTGAGEKFAPSRESVRCATKSNFFEKLPKLKKILNIWSSRDISIYGQVNIVKTSAISKLTFICNLLDTPKGFTNDVNNNIRLHMEVQESKTQKNNYNQK